jgi:hypothetical protein
MVFVLVTIVSVVKLKKNKFMKHGGLYYGLRTKLQVYRSINISDDFNGFIHGTRISNI